MSGAHAVCGAFFWSRKNSGWNGRPTFTKNANSFGLQSITRKAIFLIGLSPMYCAAISRARMKMSRIDTPRRARALARAAEQAAVETFAHRLGVFYKPRRRGSKAARASPRVTSDSLLVSANTGQTDWHVPQRMHLTSLSSSDDQFVRKLFQVVHLT